VKEFVAVAKALSDASRVRTLAALRKGELCVCRIIALLGLAPSTVSKHMSVLKHAGLVQCRKEERWMYYRLPAAGDRTALIREALDWVFRSLAKDENIKNDAVHLARILRQSQETLCRKRLKR
jgi:ArsR family transcriptional regulator, arsenate/arsenite/antimonite-responsive transcriptional repressor